MLTFPAVQVAEQRQAEAGRGWPLSGERWVIHRHMSRELLVLDRMFEPIWRVRLPVGWGGVRAVADDLSMVACTRGREVQLLAGTGNQMARIQLTSPGVPFADAGCEFSRDGRYLWAHAFVGTDANHVDDRDEVWLIDLAELKVVDHRRLDSWAGGFEAFHHPDGQTIGLDLAEGQDGNAIRWVRPAGGRIQLRRPSGFDRVLADLHPSGQEYLTTPHHAPGELIRHRYHDDQALDCLPAELALPIADEWGASQDGWYYCAGYLTDELILAGVQGEADEWHAVVQRRPMKVLGRVNYDLKEWPGWFERPQAGTWVTGGDTRLRRWELAGDPRDRFGAQLSLFNDTYAAW